MFAWVTTLLYAEQHEEVEFLLLGMHICSPMQFEDYFVDSNLSSFQE